MNESLIKKILSLLKNFFEKVKDFFRRFIFWRNKTPKISTKRKIRKRDQDKEIKKIRKIPYDVPSIHIGNQNWIIFQNLIARAKDTVKILTGSISFSALSLIFSDIKKDVDVKILTGRGRNYDKIFHFTNIERKNLKRCQKLHSKLCIIDDEIIILGSSNLTKSSLGDGERSGFLEGDIIHNDPIIIKQASILFEILWNEKSDIELLQKETSFISSAYGIPLKLKELIENAKSEIKILVPPLFRKSGKYKSISSYVRSLNTEVDIELITSHSVNEQYMEGLEEIKTLDKFKLILVKDRIHLKIYIIDNEYLIISSVNLFFPQWITSLESGIILQDKKIIKEINEEIESIKENIAPLNIVNTNISTPTTPSEEYLEKIYLNFETEGIKLFSELKREGGDSVAKETKKSIKTSKIRSTKTSTISDLPKEVKLLPELFGKKTVNKKERVKLIKKRDKLINKLDKSYDKLNKVIDKKERAIKLARAAKSIRNRAQSKLKKLKRKRRKLKRQKLQIRSNLDGSQSQEEISEINIKLNKIKDIFEEFWEIHQRFDYKSQKYHQEMISYFNKVDNLKKEISLKNEKIVEIKETINKLNIKLCIFKNHEDIDEFEWDIIKQDLFDYLLMCPYSSEKEIKWYFSDFSTKYGVLLNTDILFDILNIAFQTKEPIKIGGKIYKLISIIDGRVKSQFKSTLPAFFKNVILKRGRSGLEVKDKQEYQEFKEKFETYFSIEAPKSAEIIEAILKHKKSLNRVVHNDIYYKRILDIFENS